MKYKTKQIILGIIFLVVIIVIILKTTNILENITNINDIVKLKVQNNLTATSCTQFTSCLTCTKGKVDRTNASCYWNPTKNQCGSFKDPGYYKTCTH